MADIEGQPVHTWGRTLSKVNSYAHEALAVHRSVEVDQVPGHLLFRTPRLPDGVIDAIEQAEITRKETGEATARAAEAKAAAARALVSEAHLSMRDTAEVLGISHQCIQQLLAG